MASVKEHLASDIAMLEKIATSQCADKLENSVETTCAAGVGCGAYTADMRKRWFCIGENAYWREISRAFLDSAHTYKVYCLAAKPDILTVLGND